MALPWILGGAAVAIGAAIVKAIASDSDTSSESSYTVSDEVERRQEAEERNQKQAKLQALYELKSHAVNQYERFTADTGVPLPLVDLKRCPVNLEQNRKLVYSAIETYCSNKWPEAPQMADHLVEINDLLKTTEIIMSELENSSDDAQYS